MIEIKNAIHYTRHTCLYKIIHGESLYSGKSRATYDK